MEFTTSSVTGPAQQKKPDIYLQVKRDFLCEMPFGAGIPSD